MKTHVYKRVDGLSLHADVHSVDAADDERSPVLLLLHAGSLIAGGRAWFPQYQLDAFRRAGYVVVAVDYRLAPETKAPEIIADVADAVRWVREELPERERIDPSRLGIVGYSAGGYLTLHSGHALEPRPQALVSFYGYGDIVGDWYTSPDPHYQRVARVTRERALKLVGAVPIADASLDPARLDFYVHCRQEGSWLREVLGHEGDDLSALLPYCPERHVDATYPPTLLLHGDMDTDVPHEKSLSMAEALRAKGVEHRLLTIEGAGHTFDLPKRFQFQTGGGAAFGRKLIGWLSPALPRTSFRGRAPAGSDEYLSSVVDFLDRHLRVSSGDHRGGS